MFDHTHYVPLLKLKMGELQALKHLDLDLSNKKKERLTPLFDMPSLSPFTEGKTLTNHVEG